MACPTEAHWPDGDFKKVQQRFESVECRAEALGAVWLSPVTGRWRQEEFLAWLAEPY